MRKMGKGYATIVLLTAFILSTMLCFAAWAKEDEAEQEIDYIALAALLIKDGNYDRAENALNHVDEKDENIDLARLHTLRGLLFLSRSLFKDAARRFDLALELGSADTFLHVYAAQARYGMKEYQKALDHLHLAKDAATSSPGLFILQAQCYWKLEKHEIAWSLLEQGEERFPDAVGIARQKVFYLIELGLFQQVLETSAALLASDNADASMFLAIAEALRRSGQMEAVVQLLETARLMFTDNEAVLIGLAGAYAQAQHPLSAAELFEVAAIDNKAYHREAAEMFREAGKFNRALYHNARISEQPVKMRQRLGLLLRMSQFEQAAGLAPRLSRLGLLEDEDIRYALAYACFKVGDYDAAEVHLKKLTRSDLFRNAADLRAAMQSCIGDPWRCE